MQQEEKKYAQKHIHTQIIYANVIILPIEKVFLYYDF